MPDAHRIIGSLQQQRAGLELRTTDLCFLVALRDRAERDVLAYFDEDLLSDLFVQICEIVEPEAENPRKKATHSLQRLRDQRLLTRADGAGIVRAGAYGMTRLATAIVDFFLEDEALTREDLTALTKTLLSQLAAVRTEAERAVTEEEWRAVVAPLRATVGDLLRGIERRQRGLDVQQEEIRQRIAALLEQDWFTSVGACEELLEEVSGTLFELNQVLLQDASLLQSQLQDIEQLAAHASAAEAESAARGVSDQLERVVAWGRARQEHWSEYYQYVQRYLRSVVRLDPQRAISQRLRDQIAGWPDRRFLLVCASAAPIAVLRPVELPEERPPVSRPSEDHETPLVDVPPDAEPVALERRVEEALAAGARTLADVLAAVLPTVAEADRFRVTGRIAALVANRAHIRRSHVPPWVQVLDQLEIEDWSLTLPEKQP
jgi:chromosome partition protein MukF